MAKRMYTGDINGKAKKSKKIYIGDTNGKARIIKKMYIGDANGKARCFYRRNNYTVSYEGIIVNRRNPNAPDMEYKYLAATTVGNYALFGGGYYTYSGAQDYAQKNVIAIYLEDNAVKHKGPDYLSTGRAYLAATSVGDYALFGGGIYSFGEEYDHSAWHVDAYSSSLVKSTPDSLGTGRSRLAAVSIGDYALFGGGCYDPRNETQSKVDAYDKSLVKITTVLPLAHARQDLTAVTVGDYALFPYGLNYNDEDLGIEMYDSSLTRSMLTTETLRLYKFGAASIEGYALIGGGYDDKNGVATSRTRVRAIDKDLELFFIDDLADSSNSSQYTCIATSVNNHAIFNRTYTNETTIYDDSLIRSMISSGPNTALYAATPLGDYALFGGSKAIYGYKVSEQ